MRLPDPKPGLVISYAYLWSHEHRQGQEEGRKDRPCAVVLARQSAFGKTLATVAPITHTPPEKDEHAIEIPAAVKDHLRLDHERSWIVLTEVNDFLWPGPDLRKTPSGKTDYGMLPPRFFLRIRDRLLALHAAGLLRNVERTE